MIVRIASVASGVNRDSMPEELAVGQWSDCLNVVFKAGFMERAPGMAQLFDQPAVTPRYLGYFGTATGFMWLHAGDNKIYVDAPAGRFDISRSSSAYTETPSNRWSGGVFNGLYVLNNSMDKPQLWTGSTADKFIDLPNWPATHRAKIIRPWKNYLFALDTTVSGTRHPSRVLWSSLTDPGAPPPSWDVSDPTHDAGEIDLSETPDILVDALPLGDGLVIYKSSSMHLARWVGGQSVFSFSRLPGDVGMFAPGCAVNTPMGHVVLTLGDVVIHSGSGPRSIADGRVRKAIFNAMDSTYAETACFLAANPASNEVWVCYPSGSSSTCTMAAIWNWKEDTWAFRTLRNVTCGGAGQTPEPAGYTWETVPYTWADTPLVWPGKAGNQNDQHLVLGHAEPAISIVGVGIQDLGVNTTVNAERIGLSFDDPQTVKLLKRIWPRIDGPKGSVVYVQAGASMTPDDPPKWGDPVPFVIGVSTKVDVFAKGRFLSLRLLS